MERILVTGGSGFVGRYLVKKLLAQREDIEIRSLSRSEYNIAKLQEMVSDPRLRFIVGDLRDMTTVQFAVRDVDTVLHLAAMKHVDICEASPIQSIAVNVAGTMNLIQHFTGEAFIALSTDKAVEPCNTYGATKLLVEKMVLAEADRRRQSRFVVIRSGNILNSSGSVLEKWKQQIAENNEITITDPKMTRLFISVDCLCDFIIKAMEKGKSGYIYIPPLRMSSIGDLAKTAISLYGDSDTQIKVIGARRGERMDEKAVFEGESNAIVDASFGCGGKRQVEGVLATMRPYAPRRAQILGRRRRKSNVQDKSIIQHR
ncbi:MAG: polysaccharide biosynthesis protein [Chloroflexota bacterium]|nr:polysaccharide biosynthesis protein [Chloroflexota bacterium]